MTNSLFKTSETVSYSRLASYVECPSKYRYKYIDKLPDPSPIQDYFIKGNLAHKAIEYILEGSNKELALSLALQVWLTDNCKLPIAHTEEQAQQGLGVYAEKLHEYGMTFGAMVARTSEGYLGNDGYKTKAGELMKDWENFPTSEFKQDYQAAGLDRVKMHLDNQAATFSNSFRRFSLSNVAASAYSYVLNFEIGDFVAETLAIEYPLEQKEIIWTPTSHWNGAIDWVFKTTDGSTVICDHKTDRNKPSGLEVAWHSQLNLYVALYYEQTGIWPDYIAINHLPTAQLVVSRTNPEIVQQNYEYWQSAQRSIDENKTTQFMKTLPTKYNTPCLGRDWKSGVLSKVCPYLPHCWPDYASNIKEELDDFLT